MLVFCEECGGRNLIADTEQGMLTVKFRCVTCDYENVWPLPQESGNAKRINRAAAGEGSFPRRGSGKSGKS